MTPLSEHRCGNCIHHMLARLGDDEGKCTQRGNGLVVLDRMAHRTRAVFPLTLEWEWCPTWTDKTPAAPVGLCGEYQPKTPPTKTASESDYRREVWSAIGELHQINKRIDELTGRIDRIDYIRQPTPAAPPGSMDKGHDHI